MLPSMQWSYCLVLSASVFACLLVWIVRCIVRYFEDEDSEDVWSADWLDVTCAIGFFVLIAAIGIVISHIPYPQRTVLIASSDVLASADLPEHVTPIQRWRTATPAVKFNEAAETPGMLRKLETPQVIILTPPTRSNRAATGPFAPIRWN